MSSSASYQHDPARVQVLLRERAARLARPPADRNAEASRALMFRVAAERYSLALEWSTEACLVSRIATLPGLSPAILGICNWRGEFVVLFDSARLFGLNRDGDTPRRNMIVLRGGEPRLGLVIDRFEGTVGLDADALRPVGEGGQRGDLFRGITQDAAIVLDGGRLLQRLNEELHAT